MHLKDPTPSRYHDITWVWRETNCMQSIAGTLYPGRILLWRSSLWKYRNEGLRLRNLTLNMSEGELVGGRGDSRRRKSLPSLYHGSDHQFGETAAYFSGLSFSRAGGSQVKGILWGLASLISQFLSMSSLTQNSMPRWQSLDLTWHQRAMATSGFPLLSPLLTYSASIWSGPCRPI